MKKGNTISSFSKLDTYRSFKSSFCMEGYLDTISNRSHSVCYSKMRMSNHRFAIETDLKKFQEMNDVYFVKSSQLQ